jgi:uncharacterized protein (DUF2267 family)
VTTNDCVATFRKQRARPQSLALDGLEIFNKDMAEETAQFGAQLPMFIRGLYYEGWTPRGKPNKVRHKTAFLAPIRDHFRDDWHVEPEEIARVVLKVLAAHMSAGEIEDVKQLLPQELKELWG